MTPTLPIAPEEDALTADAMPDPETDAQNAYGEDNRDLPEQLVGLLRDTIKDYQGQEKFARRREVRRDRRLRFYEAGFQHLFWSAAGNGNGGFQLLVAGAAVSNQSGGSIQCPQFMDAYNIFYPYLWILISVLTQNPPGVDFQPDDPSVSDDIDAAKAAESYALAFDRKNDVNELQTQIVRMFGLSGRTVSWTRTEVDAQRFGTEPDGTPKRFQRTTIHGTLETKVQITAKELDKNLPYCFIYQDFDIAILKDRWSWIKDQIRPNTPALGENQYERNARLGVLNGAKSQAQTGDSMAHMGTEGHYFLRPAAFTGGSYDNPFEGGETDEESGKVLTAGEKLRQIFPQGVRPVFVGDVYAAAYPEAMDDHVEIQFPFPGDGMSRNGFMEPMVVVQDNFNDDMNWIREKIDTGAGSLWVDGTQEEIDAVTSQRAAPNAIRAWKNKVMGQPLEDSFYKEEDPQLPETLIQFIELLQGPLAQFMLAAPPALFGEAMPDQKTASGYAQARNQATGRIGVIWARLQRMFARIRYQSALAASKEPSEAKAIVVPGSKPGQSITVELANLKKGHFGCYPDEDSSFPESTQQKRATMGGLMAGAGQNPALQQLLSTPRNIAEIQRLNGISELKFIPAEARDKQLFEIEELLAAQPILPSPEEIEQAQQAQVEHAAQAIQARAAGQMEPPAPPQIPPAKPSIPIGPLDYHQWEFEEGQEWLSSKDRREADAQPNPASDPRLDALCEQFACTNYGVLNVILHVMLHQAAIPPPPMLPPPAPHPEPAAKPPDSSGPTPAPAAPAAAAI